MKRIITVCLDVFYLRQATAGPLCGSCTSSGLAHMNRPPPSMGPPRAACSAALIAAWKKLAMKHHPDKASNKEKAQAKMIEINVRSARAMHAPWMGIGGFMQSMVDSVLVALARHPPLMLQQKPWRVFMRCVVRRRQYFSAVHAMPCTPTLPGGDACACTLERACRPHTRCCLAQSAGASTTAKAKARATAAITAAAAAAAAT